MQKAVLNVERQLDHYTSLYRRLNLDPDVEIHRFKNYLHYEKVPMRKRRQMFVITIGIFASICALFRMLFNYAEALAAGTLADTKAIIADLNRCIMTDVNIRYVGRGMPILAEERALPADNAQPAAAVAAAAVAAAAAEQEQEIDAEVNGDDAEAGPSSPRLNGTATVVAPKENWRKAPRPVRARPGRGVVSERSYRVAAAHRTARYIDFELRSSEDSDDEPINVTEQATRPVDPAMISLED